ncbi:tripartite tricarboxylate transporter substrate binding protein [Bradyrhizobium sp. LHD-71]|uniref:Bug family tripartite tricarboxylate transporter substrate binding protein n=1 Tax=Bradyrhizobium sp. LHD-71 TaxID=3072141 RepID=UPI00280C45A0|nr:tripartite tricarboxylate transporter substrate binding protein [Bradyrhizobium sp. LHD-71]MDQ8726655.1 tripartite tricarboxylate transporter substrate binding protein [Bradyrhizobium sp. LHD-71]
MSGLTRRAWLSGVAVCLSAPWVRGARADESFPSRPITLIVPFPAGGTADTTFRILAKAATRHLGQPVIVENRPGASATMGAVAMLSVPPDGYRIAITHSAVLRMQLIEKTSYDALKDFTPIIQISAFNVGLIVRADSPLKNWSDFISQARGRPEEISYGTNGTATAQNLALVQVAELEKVKFTHVPFKGDAEGTAALLGGHIDAHAGGTVLGDLVDNGQARWLALFSDERVKRWPSVPTLYDLGYDVTAASPNGLIGPKGMPPEVVRRLHDAFKLAMFDPEHVAIQEKYGQPIQHRNGADFGELIKKHFELEREKIRRAGLLRS